jgi:cytochrome c556
MEMSGLRFVVSVAVAIVVAGSAAGLAGLQEATQGAAAQTVASHLVPASLDSLYPPQAPQPQYLMHMVALGARMSGVAVDLATEDFENVASSFAAFEAAYRETAGLVPEWRERFPMGPVASLGEALASGDPALVGPAFAAVGGVCAACHHDTMVAVTQRFHWQDANAITTTDPVSGQKVAHAEFMHMLDFSLTGITHDLAQGQVDSARKHYQDFRRRFAVLAETCEDCHGIEERFYFTDAASAARVEAIGAALEAAVPDAAAVQGSVMEVGFNTCHRCHLVHVPAAFTKGPALH